MWLRTFHHPVALRLQNEAGVRTLVVKQLSGAGGYEPGTIAIERTVALGDDEWNAFLKLIDEADYWALPTRNEGVMGFDGAQWILEGVKDGRYHVVDRWSPNKNYSPSNDLKFRDACLYLLELSGLHVISVY